MRLPYQVYADLDGNLSVMDGVVIVGRTGAIFHTAGAGNFFHDAPDLDYSVLTKVVGKGSALFGGGSGRNLVLAGGPNVLCGFFRPQVVDHFSNGPFLLVVTGPSAATISDGTAAVAELTTGGTAPVGNYLATSYGETTYNSDSAFTLTASAEEGGPGAVPNAGIEIFGGTAQGGIYTAVDAANYVSAVDSNWTLFIDPSGEARLKYLTEVIAVRAAGLNYDPAGLYASTTAGERYRAAAQAMPGATDVPDTNPFGILTLVCSWPATPDLDIGVEFLGDIAGFGHSSPSTGGSVGPFMMWSGDDTTPGGSETVVIDLAAAWDAGAIETFADVMARADWYPPNGGTGPATLAITYSLPGADTTVSIYPASVTPATSVVAALRILADGTISQTHAPWTATVRRVRQPTRAGTVYIQLTEAAGVLTAVAGPFLATVMPISTATDFYFPLALSDGTGGIEQLHVGSLVWF